VITHKIREGISQNTNGKCGLKISFSPQVLQKAKMFCALRANMLPLKKGVPQLFAIFHEGSLLHSRMEHGDLALLA
jgi:hypothetical protein